MGTWNAGLFSNDTTCDVKDTYLQFLQQELKNEEAFQKTYSEYEELFGIDEEPLFWYAIADTQWNVGRLMPEVKDLALKLIEEKGGIDLWEESPRHALKWEKTLQKLKEKLLSPMPPEKKFKKPAEFVSNPWNTGDVYAYQFHTEEAAEHNLAGKYILFQKIGNNFDYERPFSVVQVFDRVFDSVPGIEVLEDNIRILPLSRAPVGISLSDILPSFEYYLQAAMLYYKKLSYPKKYFTYVGNKYLPEKEFHFFMNEYDFLKYGFDYWLVPVYLSWQNVEY